MIPPKYVLAFQDAKFISASANSQCYMFSDRQQLIMKVCAFSDDSRREAFAREWKTQNKIYKLSLRKFGKSFVPKIKFNSIVHRDEIMQVSPTIAQKLRSQPDTYGILIMESAGPATLRQASSISRHAVALRLLSVLAEFGFRHEDPHDGNFIVGEDGVKMIDFGDVVEITPDEKRLVKSKTATEIIDYIYPNPYSRGVGNGNPPAPFTRRKKRERPLLEEFHHAQYANDR